MSTPGTRLVDPLVRTIAVRSVTMAIANTVLCLLIAYPFAYWIATRARQRDAHAAAGRSAHPILVELSGSNLRVADAARLRRLHHPVRRAHRAYGGGCCSPSPPCSSAWCMDTCHSWCSPSTPLSSAWTGAWSRREGTSTPRAPKAFRKITLPLSKPGIIAGSILVFIPSLGAYVTPDILGGGQDKPARQPHRHTVSGGSGTGRSDPPSPGRF